MGINGEGIGFYQKTLVFVPGALKGEDIYCQITSIKRNFVEAKLLKVNKKSKFRVVPACTIYNDGANTERFSFICNWNLVVAKSCTSTTINS